MSFKQFESDLKEGRVKNICVLYGKEAFLIKWAAQALVSRYIQKEFADFDLVRFDGQLGLDAAALVNACETIPMMSERKVVRIDDFKGFDSVSGLDEKDEKEIIGQMAGLSESCQLLFVCGEKLDKRKRIYKKVNDIGSVYEFGKLEENDLTRWIAKRFRSYKKQITTEQIRLLIESSGYYDKDSDYSLFNMDSDISKAALHADGDEIKAGDITSTVSGNIQRDVFAMIDALGRQDKKYAFEMLSHMMVAGEPVYGVLALLFRQYEHLLRIREMQEERVPMAEMRKSLGLPDFIIKKLSGYAAAYSTQKLREILRAAYRVDRHIKTGFLEPSLAVEMFIAGV